MGFVQQFGISIAFQMLFSASVEQLIEYALIALRDTLPAEDSLSNKVTGFLYIGIVSCIGRQAGKYVLRTKVCGLSLSMLFIRLHLLGTWIDVFTISANPAHIAG